MAGIGDLYYAFRGDGARLQADAKKEGAKAGEVGAKSFGAKFSGGLKGAFKGGKHDLLAALGIGAGIGVATVAIGKLVDVMGDATEAAIEEEESVARLDAALRANVASYDGNTDAIEETLKARMRLGFADDEQRESLALAVAATNDETKALALQRTAMDLSRLKKISLAEATQALIKVEGGQFRILKSLGIQLPKNATAQEALVAVQKVATGQAEAYARTSRGKLLASQIRVGEVMEKLGAVTMPAVVEALDAAAGFIETLADGLDDLGDSAKRSNDDLGGNFLNILDDIGTRGNESKTALGTLDEALSNLVDNAIDALTPWDQFTEAMADQAQAARETAETNRETNRGLMATEAAADVAIGAIDDTGGAFGDLGEASGEAADDVETSVDRIKRLSGEMRDKIIDDARDVVTNAYDVIADRAELTAATIESTELRKVIATGNATREQKDRYKELGETQAQLIIDLAENGAQGSSAVNLAMNDIRKRLEKATGQERKALLATLRVLEDLEAQARATARQVYNAATGLGGPGPRRSGARAHGGPVEAGVPVWTGELGKELFTPTVDGYVIPHTQSMNIASGGGGDTINIPLNITGLPMQAESPADVVRELRRASRLGLTPPRRHKAFSR